MTKAYARQLEQKKTRFRSHFIRSHGVTHSWAGKRASGALFSFEPCSCATDRSLVFVFSLPWTVLDDSCRPSKPEQSMAKRENNDGDSIINWFQADSRIATTGEAERSPRSMSSIPECAGASNLEPTKAGDVLAMVQTSCG